MRENPLNDHAHETTLRLHPGEQSQRHALCWLTGELYGRIAEHKQGLIEGFTRKHGVTRLVYYETHETMDDAIRREKQLKKWNRLWKLRIIEEINPEWMDLFDATTGVLLDASADRPRLRT